MLLVVITEIFLCDSACKIALKYIYPQQKKKKKKKKKTQKTCRIEFFFYEKGSIKRWSISFKEDLQTPRILTDFEGSKAIISFILLRRPWVFKNPIQLRTFIVSVLLFFIFSVAEDGP